MTRKTPLLLNHAAAKRDPSIRFAYSQRAGVNLAKDGRPAASERHILATTMSKTNANIESDDPDR